MKKNNIIYGLSMAIGFYLYDVITSLIYDKLPLSEALISAEWGRLFFILNFGTLLSYFTEKIKKNVQ